jgi:hypothetical protein
MEKLSGQIDAFIRQGAKDLHNAIVPAFPDSARSMDEPGMPLNPTSQMVTQDLGASYEDFLSRHHQEPTQETDRGGMER